MLILFFLSLLVDISMQESPLSYIEALNLGCKGRSLIESNTVQVRIEEPKPEVLFLTHIWVGHELASFVRVSAHREASEQLAALAMIEFLFKLGEEVFGKKPGSSLEFFYIFFIYSFCPTGIETDDWASERKQQQQASLLSTKFIKKKKFLLLENFTSSSKTQVPFVFVTFSLYIPYFPYIIYSILFSLHNQTNTFSQHIYRMCQLQFQKHIQNSCQVTVSRSGNTPLNTFNLYIYLKSVISAGD